MTGSQPKPNKSLSISPIVRILSVTKEFDGLLVTFGDGDGDGDEDKDSKQNGTGMTTGAVLMFSAGC